MDDRLRRLLDAVWEHDLPLGPFGDLDFREQAEREWEDALTAEDCLALLNWAERPLRPAHWNPASERWLMSLADSAARHAGRAGRRVGDARVTCRLVDLLGEPNCRATALEGLYEIRDPAAFDVLCCLFADRAARCEVSVAIAVCATSVQVGQLRALAALAPTARLREAAVSVLLEWEWENGPAPDGPAIRPLSDGAELRSWRTTTAVLLARQMDTSGDFSAVPILADALQDAGCGNEPVLDHCRRPGSHVRGCWVIDLVLGRGGAEHTTRTEGAQ